MVRVKICGITSRRDALTALAAGADALGFVFAKSPRKVSAGKARAIADGVGPWIATVGVFVNERPSKILRIARRCRLGAVQLHGDESPADVRAIQKKGYSVIKAVRVKPGLNTARLERYGADAYLLDTAVSGVYGGTGKSFDWRLLSKLKFKKPVIVSGGLKPANVKRLLRRFRPYGVDVSSGVEKAPGVKSEKLIKEFIRNARS